MAATNFRQSLSLVLAHEGGYVNHPKDPGGPTNCGITQKVYDAYCDYMHLKRQSVANIKQSEISDIYNKQYWRTIKGDSLSSGLDYAVFDFGVNSGVARASKYLQRLVGVEPDGIIGLVTLSAVEAKMAENPQLTITQYCANRLTFLRSLPTFATFGLGWTRRVVGYRAGVQSDDSGVLDYAIAMAKGGSKFQMPSQIGTLSGEIVGKATVPDTDTSYPEAPLLQGKTLAQLNDQLAAIILANG